MKLLTLNTHSWMEENQDDKFETLLDTILEENYDLICLQEINQLMTSQEVTETPAYVATKGAPAIHEDHYVYRLQKALAKHGKVYHWSWAYNHIGYDRYHEGVAVLSKTPIKAEAVLVSDVNDEKDHHTRRVLVGQTQVDGHEVLVISCHLSWWGQGFEEEWEQLTSYLEDVNLPIIMMGDFNNPQGDQGYEMILESPLGLQDSHAIAKEVEGEFTIREDIDGWEGNTRNLKVDYIFTSKELTVNSSKIIFDGKYKPVVSDHFGIAVEGEWGE